MKNNGWTLRKRAGSFCFAWKGICRLFACEANAQIHCVAAIVAIALGWWLDISVWEWVAVIGCIGVVLMAEAFNSAIESLCDRITKEYDEAIKHTKDMASGAVLLIAMTSVAIGLIIFLPKLMERFIEGS